MSFYFKMHKRNSTGTRFKLNDDKTKDGSLTRVINMAGAVTSDSQRGAGLASESLAEDGIENSEDFIAPPSLARANTEPILHRKQKIAWDIKTESNHGSESSDLLGPNKNKQRKNSHGSRRGGPQTQRLSQPKAGKTIFNNLHAKAQIQEMKDKKKEENIPWYRQLIIYPFGKFYRVWWVFTVFATAYTFFFETYQIAFPPGGLQPPSNPASITNFTLISIFALDMIITFNLAYFNSENQLVYNHADIARRYLGSYFWIDLIGVMPIYLIALKISGMYLEDNTTTQYLSLLRLLRLVRMRRIKDLFEIVKFSTRVSLMSLTLSRNATLAMVWTHFAACVFYFIAKQYEFDPDTTWIGPHDEMTTFEAYITTLYWSVVTFTTVGYGDFSPVNAAEQIFGMVYMLMNIILMSYIIGSITLLVVKNDEATGDYRASLQSLYSFADANGFVEDDLHKRLKSHLKVEYNHRDTEDESVLNKFPKPMKEKILLKLYGPYLNETNLLNGIREQFITSFLLSCRIVLFSSTEELLTRGSISSDLFLLVEGTVELKSIIQADGAMKSPRRYSHDGSEEDTKLVKKRMSEPDFINEVSFFTDSPQIDTVTTVTVCKTLIISKQNYKVLADDHPGSAGKVLTNLLYKAMAIQSQQELNSRSSHLLPKSIPVLNAGSVFDNEGGENYNSSFGGEITEQSIAAVQTNAALSSLQDLIEMHINKQKDDHTTRFLFAASRDDTATIKIMCDQGFDPNSSDYDERSALMVAAMKGNLRATKTLLEYGADPDQRDHHGTTAVLEAVTNGHDEIIELLINQRKGHDLYWLNFGRASALLNQAVFDGNIPLLQRLLRAKIDVNAGDYDMRRPLHIAAAEGNLAAFKLLEQAGADINLLDRFDNSPYNDAQRAKAGKLIEYIETIQKKKKGEHSPFAKQQQEEEQMHVHTS